MFGQSLSEMMSSNSEMLSEEEECLLAFIGALQIPDLLAIVTSN